MPACGVCLKSTVGSDRYHRPCLERLFGVGALPRFDRLDLRAIYRLATEMAGKMSLSGAQEKVSFSLSDDGNEVVIAAQGGRFILKPEPARFASVPENEHVSMLQASLAGIETPPFGLVWLKDSLPAYVIKRFDRLDDDGKLHLEDFCQLGEQPARSKYQGSAEQCVRILRKYASEPLIEVRKLFKMLLFSWWISNGDHHLKNLSLLIDHEGSRSLAPAYDMVCTRLIIPSDRSLALSVGGKKSNLTRKSWLDFAQYCQIAEKAARRLLDEQIDATAQSIELIRASFLPDELKGQYVEIVSANTGILSAD